MSPAIEIVICAVASVSALILIRHVWWNRARAGTRYIRPDIA